MKCEKTEQACWTFLKLEVAQMKAQFLWYMNIVKELSSMSFGVSLQLTWQLIDHILPE